MTTYDDCHIAVEAEPGVVVADDGRPLRATWHRPDGPVRGAVVVVPAMATPAAFYRPFATWLAERGFLALTFDYRGTGSREEMRAETGDLVRWAGDAASALEALLEEVDGEAPVTWVGHSLGGQVLPFARHDLLDRVVLVASGSGYWRLNQPAMRRRAPLLWRGIAPVSIGLAGYYPGRRLGLLGDLPAGVMRQWARWCLHPSYAAVDVPDIAARFAEVTPPVSAISMVDDELLSEASHRALEDLLTGAPLERLRLSPAELGVDRIGHHGFFRPALQASWDAVVLPRLASRD